MHLSGTYPGPRVSLQGAPVVSTGVSRETKGICDPSHLRRSARPPLPIFSTLPLNPKITHRHNKHPPYDHHYAIFLHRITYLRNQTLRAPYANDLATRTTLLPLRYDHRELSRRVCLPHTHGQVRADSRRCKGTGSNPLAYQPSTLVLPELREAA